MTVNQFREQLKQDVVDVIRLRGDLPEMDVANILLVSAGKLDRLHLELFLVEATMMLADKDSDSGDWLN